MALFQTRLIPLAKFLVKFPVKFRWRWLRLPLVRSQHRLLGLTVLGLILALGIAGIRSPVWAQPVTLTFLVGAQEISIWQPHIQAFEAENPNIRINVIEGPNATNLVEDLYTSAFLLGDSPYDLVYMDIVWVPKFAAAGWLMDLSDRLTPEAEADYLPGDLAGGRYNGGLYRMPLRSDAGMLYYRKDLIAQANVPPPETFEDLKQSAKELQDSGKVPWGYVWQGKQYEGLSAMFVEILAGHGAFWVNPQTREVGLDRPEAIAAVQFLQSTIAERISPTGVTTYQEEESRRLFQTGKAVYMRNWPYAWPLAQTEDSAVRGKIAIKPMVHAPGQRSGACQGGWGWGIAKTTAHPEETWKAVEFFSSPAVQKAIALDWGYLPSRRSLYQDPEIVEKYPYFPAMLEVLKNSSLRPPIAQYAQASDILQRYLSAALTGRMTAEDAMQAAAQETRQVLRT